VIVDDLFIRTWTMRRWNTSTPRIDVRLWKRNWSSSSLYTIRSASLAVHALYFT